MSRRSLVLLMVLALVLSISAPAWAAPPQRLAPGIAPAAVVPAASTDDDIPGVPVNWWEHRYSGNVTTLGGDVYDVLQVQLEEGQSFRFTLTGLSMDADLYVYTPAAASIADTANIYASSTNNADISEVIEGTAPYAGCWYIVVKAKGWTSYSVLAYFSTPDDDIPGILLSAQPHAGHLDSFHDWDDVGKLWLNAGDVLVTELALGPTADPGFDPDLYLYDPYAPDVWAEAVAWSEDAEFPKVMAYLAEVSGYYYIDVFQTPEAPTRVCGDTAITWTVFKPVYRFYNFLLGTHFYTADYYEALNVDANLWETYEFEGIGYMLNPANNSMPLYRFYKPSTGTHFYTADVAERANVIANLPHLYTYEGPAYNVSADSAGGTKDTVWRFYNRNTGTHFYTADPGEKANVQATLSHIYILDGPAFYLGL